MALFCASLSAGGNPAGDELPARPALPGSGWVNVRDHGASGSDFQTVARVEAGTNRVAVADTGDFAPGQGVTISPACIRYDDVRIYEPDEKYRSRPATNEFDLRGFDAIKMPWRTFVLDFDGESNRTFRWSGDIAKTWITNVAISGDWQKLSDGVEIRFNTREWVKGHMVSFHARADLVTEIVSITNNILTLKNAANLSNTNAIIRHHDRAAIERALNDALERKSNLFIPAGHYRLDKGFTIPAGKSIWIEGESGEGSFLNISEGMGPIFYLHNSGEVTLRSLRLMGHTGFNETQSAFRRANSVICYTANLRPCGAVSIRGARQVWIENVHASRMANECFYSQGGGRKLQEDRPGTQAITYLGCTVKDVAFNAFNNNDFADNTSILYCRVDGAGNFWEGSSRFLRCIGNHVRNCVHYGTFGGLKHRWEHFTQFGAGQMVVANNVFEGMDREHGGNGPLVDGPAEQVIIRDNIFVNFSSGSALRLGGESRGYPCGNITVSGNMIDLTHEADRREYPRTGILIAAPNVVASDNQIYVRGEVDQKVTGISVADSAVNVAIHDNIIRGCGCGILATSSVASVVQALEPGLFLAGKGIDKDWPHSHRYRGWRLHWLTGANSGKVSEVDHFDAGTLAFKLKEPLKLAAGDSFAYFPPQANWLIHHNLIENCAWPVVLENYGSDTSLFTDNLVSRGLARGVKEALTLKGNFVVSGNRISGFNEPDSVAIGVYPDPLKRLWDKNCTNNAVSGCSREIFIMSE